MRASKAGGDQAKSMRRVTLVIIFLLVLWVFWWAYTVGPVATDNAAGAAKTSDGQSLLRRGNGQEPESLDPHKAQTDSAQNIIRDLFEGLTVLSPDGRIVPGTAESWTLNDAGTTYTFYIRENARWSNGNPVTAHDFVYAFRRLVTPATASPYAQMLAQVTSARDIIAGNKSPDSLGVLAQDERTLVVELHTPTPYFLGLLANASTAPVHRKSIEEHGKYFVRPGNLVSNGAYVLKERVVGSHVTVARNEQYWDNENTAIDNVTFLHIVDETSELQRFRAGELDVTYTIPMERTAWLRQNMGEQLRIEPYLGTYYYVLNLEQPPFKNNPALREALSLAIDRAFITTNITAAGQLPADGWVPPGVNGYSSQKFDYAQLDYQHRVARAKELYADAGYSADNPLELTIHYNTGTGHQQIAAAIASMWKEHLGVETGLFNVELRVLIQMLKQRADYQVGRISWLGDYNDAYTFAEILRSDHGINYPGYRSEAYDSLLDKASSESDMKRRRALLEKAERLVLKDHPIIPLYYYVSRHLLQPFVLGWGGNVMDYHYSRHLRLAD